LKKNCMGQKFVVSSALSWRNHHVFEEK